MNVDSSVYTRGDSFLENGFLWFRFRHRSASNCLISHPPAKALMGFPDDYRMRPAWQHEAEPAQSPNPLS